MTIILSLVLCDCAVIVTEYQLPQHSDVGLNMHATFLLYFLVVGALYILCPKKVIGVWLKFQGGVWLKFQGGVFVHFSDIM